MSILEVSGLRKVYTTRFGGSQVEALRNVNFSVEEGEYVAIMGESGSGKTTLLNILAALDRPTDGAVLLDGQRSFRRARAGGRRLPARAASASCFRSSTCWTRLRIEDNIYLPLVLAGKRYEEMREPAAAAGAGARHFGAAEKISLRGLRRAEAARRRGPRAHHEPAPHPRRRADRRARQPGDGRAAAPVRGRQPPRADHPDGDALSQGREPRRAACCLSATARSITSSTAARTATRAFYEKIAGTLTVLATGGDRR